MRSTYIETLTEMARKDERIICVLGDTGFSVFEDFEAEFGERFVNVGIAEQNFVSFGAGLAAMGLKPYIYNVVSFMTLRAAEQIMLDVCYQENPVRFIGVGGGFSYSVAGPTHHSLQDIAIMSTLPNMTVLCPADPIEMKAAMIASWNYEKPIYIRIGRSVDPVVHKGNIDFEIGRAIPVIDGEDCIVYATGTMLKDAVVTVSLLNEKGIFPKLYSMPSICPMDEDRILEDVEKRIPIFTMEEHGVIGGLGDAVGRVVLDNSKTVRLHKFGVERSFAPVTGSREYLLDIYGLSPKKMVEKICEMIK